MARTTARLTIPALFVRQDEPCYCLSETIEQAAGSRGWRRVQTVTVVRDDRLANARTDLGPADAFRAPEFICPGGVTDETTGKIHILHTVGELRDVADRHRDGVIAAPDVQPDDLLGHYHDLMDRRAKARRHASLFGPAGHHQRSA
jgi:hypothetical protein